jgi:hypothetical protein
MIKPAYLLEGHTLKTFPNFPCPRCSATLQPIAKSFFNEQSSASRKWQESGDGNIDDIVGVFSLRLQCSNTNCAEQVFCVGDFHLTEEASEYDDQVDFVPCLRPQFFTPAIPLFPIHPKIDDPNGKNAIANPLWDSFSLFWNSPSAAGNALRIALEALMDYRGIKKRTKNKHGKLEDIKLHSRIDMFKKKHPNLANLGDKLIAIKWIGNGGSHLAGLDRKHMITAYQLMEHVIDELFNKTTEKLTKTAEVINKTKKPV